MDIIFIPDVVVTEQALARKERFRKNKQNGIISEQEYDDMLPTIWFDDLGEIKAVTYDSEFEADSTWTTHDFDLITLRMIKGNNPSYYTVVRKEEDSNISYQIVLRKSVTKQSVTQDTGLAHASKLRPNYPVDIIFTVTETNINLSFSEVGKQMITKHPEKYIKSQTLKFYVTEPMNVHMLLEEFTVNLDDLIVGDVDIKTTSDYSLKSIYGQRPFVYGRV